MNNIMPVMPPSRRIEDTEDYEDLALMVARREMSADEFSRRIKELENDRRHPNRH